jgi:hypothetical protein
MRPTPSEGKCYRYAKLLSSHTNNLCLGLFIYITTLLVNQNDRVICKRWIGKDMEGSCRGLISNAGLIPDFFRRELRKTARNLNQPVSGPISMFLVLPQGVCIVFGRWPVRISLRSPAILANIFHGFRMLRLSRFGHDRFIPHPL